MDVKANFLGGTNQTQVCIWASKVCDRPTDKPLILAHIKAN